MLIILNLLLLILISKSAQKTPSYQSVYTTPIFFPSFTLAPTTYPWTPTNAIITTSFKYLASTVSVITVPPLITPSTPILSSTSALRSTLALISNSSSTAPAVITTKNTSLTTQSTNNKTLTTGTTASSKVTITTAKSLTTSALPVTYALLLFYNNNSYKFNLSDFLKTFNNSNIPAQDITFTSNGKDSSQYVNKNYRKRSVPSASDILVIFKLNTNNISYWRDFIKNRLPLQVVNSRNESISTTQNVTLWNDKVCGSNVCNGTDMCAVNYAMNNSLKCFAEDELNPPPPAITGLSTTPSGLRLELALLAIPCFIILLLVMIGVYCVCKTRKNQKRMDGKFDMSQIHSAESDSYNNEGQMPTGKNTISSRGSVEKPYGDDRDDDDEEPYNYKSLNDFKNTQKSNMMF